MDMQTDGPRMNTPVRSISLPISPLAPLFCLHTRFLINSIPLETALCGLSVCDSRLIRMPTRARASITPFYSDKNSKAKRKKQIKIVPLQKMGSSPSLPLCSDQPLISRYFAASLNTSNILGFTGCGALRVPLDPHSGRINFDISTSPIECFFFSVDPNCNASCNNQPR